MDKESIQRLLVYYGDRYDKKGSYVEKMYWRPKAKTIASYRNAGFKVMRTDRQGKDAVIELKE